MKWFKLHSEIKDDPKMLEMDDCQRWLWICLLAMVSESKQRRGMLFDVRLRGLAAALRTDEQKLSETLQLWTDLDMIAFDTTERTIAVLHWDERQYDNPSDLPEQSRERKRKSRSGYNNVTTMSRPGHDIDTDTDTEIDIEKKNTPLPPKGESKPKPPKPPSSEQSDMFGAIAETCELDATLKRGQIAKTAQALIAAGYTPAQVRGFKEWWQSDDWRLEHTPTPSIAQLTTKLQQFKNASDPGKPVPARPPTNGNRPMSKVDATMQAFENIQRRIAAGEKI